jgi:S-ribosylhomocysteine lyase LuxS involved in autoinducer biosynthesis
MEQVPGATEKECGNYREHDLAEAKEYLKKYLEAIGG